MSQTTSMSQPPIVGQTTGVAQPASVAQQPSQPTLSGRLNDAATSARRAMSGTPGRLRILALLTVAVSLIFALSAFSTFGSTNEAAVIGVVRSVPGALASRPRRTR